MSKPHPHKDLIIAWANGEKIQMCRQCTKEWEDVGIPNWIPSIRYRIKPRPDLIRYGSLHEPDCWGRRWSPEKDARHNLKATWKDVDGEYVLHSVEVIK